MWDEAAILRFVLTQNHTLMATYLNSNLHSLPASTLRSHIQRLANSAEAGAMRVSRMRLEEDASNFTSSRC